MAYSYLDKAWADGFWRKVKNYVDAHGGGTPPNLGDLAYKDDASGSFTPAGTVSQPSFSGSSMTSTGSFTPSGNVSAPTITVTPSTANIATMTATGSLPSLTMSVTGRTLAITFGAGTLPTQGSATVMVGASASASTPSFTGTEGSVSVTGTPTGTVSQPTFSGNAGTVTVS